MNCCWILLLLFFCGQNNGCCNAGNNRSTGCMNNGSSCRERDNDDRGRRQGSRSCATGNMPSAWNDNCNDNGSGSSRNDFPSLNRNDRSDRNDRNDGCPCENN